ncbi:MAG: hypothetical protein HYR55_10545 [Acidobacteria bacterium]|nr:hypothetical protein [Acidobacteriota bacterium]MBI3656995.1 hypothetical protein [Acidobacteriota bacterium]
MRLEQCNLDVDQVVGAPVQRNDPDPIWVRDRDAGLLPDVAFGLYARAGFLSFGAAPPFLTDEKRFLFSYFSMLMNSLRESLVDADDDLSGFIDAHGRTYDPGKRAQGEAWDPDADDRARKHFRLFLLSLQSALDASADLTALFLTGLIPGLRLGRAQFSQVETWLQRPLPAPGLVVTPQRQFLERLYSEAGRLVCAEAPQRDWLALMRMLRNKAAHLGDNVFRYVSLHDNGGRFYTFVPRRWPFIWEEHMHLAGKAPADPQPVADLFRATLVQDDIVAFANGLRAQVTILLAAVVGVVDGAFVAFREFGTNAAALAELEGSSHTFEFRHWA